MLYTLKCANYAPHLNYSSWLLLESLHHYNLGFFLRGKQHFFNHRLMFDGDFRNATLILKMKQNIYLEIIISPLCVDECVLTYLDSCVVLSA